jgi:hypothetical protein
VRAELIAIAALLTANCRNGDPPGAADNARPGQPTRVTYADQQPAPPANPTGAYWEGERLWIWSDTHPVERSYERAPGAWRAGPVRQGPAGTERCLVGRSQLQGQTFCVGRYQNGGLVAFTHGSSAGQAFGALPARAGFRDLVLMPELGLLGVLDTVTEQLVILDRKGAVLAGYPVGPASYRVGSAGGDRVFVLSGGAPQLRVLRVAADGSGLALAQLDRAAPLRDAVYDEQHDLLWLAGPEDHAVRRDRGPLEHLNSELVALDAAALDRGEFHVQVRFDLGARGLADPTRLASHSGQLFASLTGSDKLAWLSRVSTTWELHTIAAGLGPAGIAGDGRWLAVAARLDDRVYLYDPGAGSTAAPEVIALDERPRDSARDLGERLFYGALLWSQSRERPFTCNSCHWDTESDRRRHPGLRELRFEQTRPLGGIGALSPIFTPGQARSVDDAVDGLIRALDDRYWRDREFAEDAIDVRVKGGGLRRLKPIETRRALSAFLATLPVVPGPYLRTPDAELRELVTRGAQLFLADCADCHKPRGQDSQVTVFSSAESLLETAKRWPLVLGATGFAHAGAGPSFTDIGNRISPLMGLSRGGPYFASGSAPDLRAVVTGFTRVRPGVHDAKHGGVYDGHQIAALEAFLRAL